MTNYDLLDHDIRPLGDVRLTMTSPGRKKGSEKGEEEERGEEKEREEGVKLWEVRDNGKRRREMKLEEVRDKGNWE